jgi:hypothetical protein
VLRISQVADDLLNRRRKFLYQGGDGENPVSFGQFRVFQQVYYFDPVFPRKE